MRLFQKTRAVRRACALLQQKRDLLQCQKRPKHRALFRTRAVRRFALGSELGRARRELERDVLEEGLLKRQPGTVGEP